MGFFDLTTRSASLDAKNDPVLTLDKAVPWERFRDCLETVMMLIAIVLCSLYNLSGDQVDDQSRDRLSFMIFLGLGLKGNVSDAKTVWPYRDQWADASVGEDLFDDFEGYLKAKGYLAMGGQVIDAYIVCSVGSKASFDKH